ncbi:MAG: hypothetical protein FVQ83_04615 [Chloroflexi bacterium]|nr:hypothetical protein [Chloroflexota bacterium]
MQDKLDLQKGLREHARAILEQLTASKRETLLIKGWMSHDARWFGAAAQELGMQVANQLNQIAAHDVGEVEARRIVRTLQLPAVESLDDYLLIQEVFIGLLGPDLLKYQIERINGSAFEIHIKRCFAFENISRAGMTDDYVCGILARITGWLDALELDYNLDPPIGLCLKCQEKECVYRLSFEQTNWIN